MPRLVKRSDPEEIAHAIKTGGRIKLETAAEMLRLIEEKTDHVAWIAVEVQTRTMLKTVDNEEDAQETIRRLRAAPPKETEGAER